MTCRMYFPSLAAGLGILDALCRSGVDLVGGKSGDSPLPLPPSSLVFLFVFDRIFLVFGLFWTKISLAP